MQVYDLTPRERAILRAKGLAALANNPTTPPHESDSARRALARVMESFGLTAADLETTDKRQEHSYSYRTQEQKDFLLQIMHAVMAFDENRHVWKRGKKKALFAELTLEEHGRVTELYAEVWRLWLQEVDALRYAIMDSAHILKPASGKDNKRSAAQLEAIQRHVKNVPPIATNAPRLQTSGDKPSILDNDELTKLVKQFKEGLKHGG